MILTTALVLELVRHSLTGSHCRYRQYVNDIPTDVYVTRPCDANDLSADLMRPASDAAASPLRIVNGRTIRREIVEEKPLQPYAYDYDVESGALVQRIPLFFQGGPARVFDPNPVVTLNDPSLQDRNDSAAAVPEAAYKNVEVDLNGPHVRIIERQPPNVPPADPNGSLLFNREESGFEDVNAAFHVDRTQRYLQSLGYSGERAIVPYAIDVDTHAVNGDDNSFFLPSQTRIGFGALLFGEGGTDDAEDADLVVHEYTHAMLEWIAPGTFFGTFASESRALSEGFGDYWAYSQHVAQREASGRDPFCFADWDARCWEDDPSQRCAYQPNSDCLRRLDSTATMANYERNEGSGVEHRNGAIWSSALREIHQQIGKTAADTIVLESIFDTPPHPTFAIAARRLLDADRELYNAAHAAQICSAMLARGILMDCENRPRGEQTLFQSGERGLRIPDAVGSGVTSRITIDDPRLIERVAVRVDIVHRTRGDLRLELIAPDGTTVLLQQISSELTPDIHTTFGITADPVQSLDVLRGRSAAGTWQLVVRDLRTLDAGTLVSWGLLIQFAGQTPLATRPRGTRAQMIPAVAHASGLAATPFRSDVRIANPHATRQTVTLIFTRSGEDGRTSFSAIEAVLEPRQTLAFDDVVESAFHTSGTGSLEILGDVIVMSRTYAVTPDGTMGQQIPPNLDTTAIGERQLEAVALPLGDYRLNAGIVETAGGSGTVRIGTRLIPILPYSHVQFAFPIEEAPRATILTVTVAEGDARVAAYLSQVDNQSSDAMFIPAMQRREGAYTVMAPVVRTRGANETDWRSDVWLYSFELDIVVRLRAIEEGRTVQRDFLAAGVIVLEDVLAHPFFDGSMSLAALIAELPYSFSAMSRIRTDGMSQFVPFLDPAGPAEQQLVFIESANGYRTNIGIVAEEAAIAEVVIYDAAGAEVSRTTLSTSGGVAQTAVLAPVIGGRATVRFTSGRGRAYASLVDNRTGDATYVAGQ
ncbi:MAG TPA: proprotein convertase P-domain-containing protein [Thermoanaerobaculia bacterium]